jgi:hypothetical protein
VSPGGRARGPAEIAQELGPEEGGVRKRRAPGFHCRRWPPRGRAAARMARTRAAAFPRRYCPSLASAAAWQPREGRAAPRSLPPRRAANAGLRSLPRSRLRHELHRAASRAAASSGRRRRHVFLPCTWPCHRDRWLCSAPVHLKCLQPTNACSCCSFKRCPGDCERPPSRPNAPDCWKWLSRRRRLFRLPHRAKAAAILARPSKAARGATQAAAAGAACRPHHLKRQERGRQLCCGGGFGRRREAGGGRRAAEVAGAEEAGRWSRR